MRDDVPALLPLICPRCRTRSDAGREMHTLSLARASRRGDYEDGNEVVEGLLSCDNPDCRHEYPIVSGVPLVAPHLREYLAANLATVIEADLSLDVVSRLVLDGPDDAPYPRLVEHLSIYLDAHWGDRATPPPDLTVPIYRQIGQSFGMAALAEKVAARAAFPVERAVELGTSVGRGLAELSRGARITAGIDLHFGALRRARTLLSGAPLPYLRRAAGRHYVPAEARAGDLASPGAVLLCADALDPPLVPGTFQRVLALNVLDSVRDPRHLITVADGLLERGGEMLVSSPYSFQSGIVDEDLRFGGRRPEADLRARLLAGTDLEAPYSIEEEDHLPWLLRRDSFSAQVYGVHYLRAKKGTPK